MGLLLRWKEERGVLAKDISTSYTYPTQSIHVCALVVSGTWAMTDLGSSHYIVSRARQIKVILFPRRF